MGTQAPLVFEAVGSTAHSGSTSKADAPSWPSNMATVFVSFHDATLAAIAECCPATLDDLQSISGMGAKKLEAYSTEVLRVCRA